MYNKVLNVQSKPCLQDLLSEQTTVSVTYIFPFLPDSLLIEHLKLSYGIHSFFSESELRFSGNYYVLISFQIEWPDRTSQVSIETVAFVVFCPV